MASRVAIDFPAPTIDDIHRIRNLGEDLYRTFRDNGWAQISLDAVDSAVERLVVTVPHRKQLCRVEALIERMLADQHLDRIGTISRVSSDG